MRKLVIAAAFGLFAGTACAQPAPAAAAAPPRLVIAISVDQLSGDLFDQYRPHFTGGLARLARGTAFSNGFQAHAATETCPGHSTILTGTHPANNGIIANNWWNLRAAREDKLVYCAEDERVPGSTSRDYTVSPVHLKVPALGDLLKRRSPQSLSVAVAGKDRSAVMMGGHNPDQRWWWESAGFATDLRQARVPASVTAATQAVKAMIAAPQPALQSPPVCAARARPIAIGGGATVGTGRFERPAGSEPLFRASPAYDGAILALAASLIEEMRLGRDASPDVLAIGLAATDYVGHRYGPAGQEMCLQLLALDRELGDFFRLLDGKGIDYSVVLTADHGVSDLPERARLNGVTDAARVDPALEADAIGRRIGAAMNIAGPILVGDYAGDIWINPALAPAQREQVLQQALSIYRAHPQVAAAYSSAELGRMRIPSTPPDRWSLAERARASFDPERSGDMVVLLKRNVTPIPVLGTLVGMHGSPWDYDRRVPILFWRRGMPASSRGDAIATVDIMPTLAAMLGLPLDRPVDGKCVSGISGIACPAR
jgi:predicted AlkP superfamily pyrophosphatase or phosphodiesterase